MKRLLPELIHILLLAVCFFTIYFFDKIGYTGLGFIAGGAVYAFLFIKVINIKRFQ